MLAVCNLVHFDLGLYCEFAFLPVIWIRISPILEQPFVQDISGLPERGLRWCGFVSNPNYVRSITQPHDA